MKGIQPAEKRAAVTHLTAAAKEQTYARLSRFKSDTCYVSAARGTGSTHTASHQIHRLQNLKRAYLTHSDASVQVQRGFRAVASDAPDEMGPGVHQGPQEIIQPRVKVLSQRGDRLVPVQAERTGAKNDATVVILEPYRTCYPLSSLLSSGSYRSVCEVGDILKLTPLGTVSLA